MTPYFNIDANGGTRANCTNCEWTTPVLRPDLALRSAAHHTCQPNWKAGPGNLPPTGDHVDHVHVNLQTILDANARRTTERTPAMTTPADETVPVSLDLLLRVNDLLRAEGFEEISDDLRAALPSSPITAALDVLHPFLVDVRARPDADVPFDFIRDVLAALDSAGLLVNPDAADRDLDAAHPNRRPPRPGDTWLAECDGDPCVAIRNTDRDGESPWTVQSFHDSSANYRETDELDLDRPLHLA